MALTPDEILNERLTNPYYGQAEALTGPSLAERKKMSLAAASVEKKRDQDPAAAIAEDTKVLEHSLAGGNLLDLAESGFYQAGSQLKDFFTPREFGEPRTNEEIREQADIEAGLSPEARQRLATDPQQRVMESLAQGDFVGAIPEAIKAAPGVIAESSPFIAEIGAGALLTRFGGAAGRKVAGKRAKSRIGQLFDRKDAARDNLADLATDPIEAALTKAATAVPKAAAQVSLATADITQRQNNDFRELHGRDMDRGELATSYAINLATMMPQPAIIKNLFIPSFKKEITKEIKTLGKNIIGGSNARNVAARVADGTKKVLTAAGAEAAQEYFQTWADVLNTQLGPEERKNFFESAMEVFGDEENQLQALAGLYLGGGAGGVTRAAISAPAVTGGVALDTAKGTAKTAVKATTAVSKKAARTVQKAVNIGAFKVLSDEERDVITSEHESRKEIAANKIADFEIKIDRIKKATTLESLSADDEINALINKIVQSRELTDTDMENKRTFESVKADAIRAYRGDIGLLNATVAATHGADIAAQTTKKIKSKSVETAKAAMEAVSPGVDAVVATVEQHGKAAVKAVRELRSSTALGMIELAATAGKEETKQIVEAAKSLSLDDLQRATAVISDVKPEVAKQLQTVIRQKERVLEKTGVKSKEIINAETLSPAIAAVAKKGSLDSADAAAVSSILNKALAGKIQDKEALTTIMEAVAAVESSEAFKTQTKGVMSRNNMVVLKRKLKRTNERLAKEPSVVEKAVDVAKDVGKTVKEAAAPAAKKAGEAIAAAAAPEIKISPTFRTIAEAAIKSMEDPKVAASLVEAAPVFVKQMKAHGVKTRSDFLKFIAEFPELENNVAFFQVLEDAFPSDITAKEVFDNMTTRGIDAVDAVKKAYNDLNTAPECKV